MAALVTWLIVVILIVVVVQRTRRQRTGRRHGGVGTAAVGTIYDMLSEERRNAVEIILEQRAEARDPEDKDGNLPDLERPR